MHMQHTLYQNTQPSRATGFAFTNESKQKMNLFLTFLCFLIGLEEILAFSNRFNRLNATQNRPQHSFLPMAEGSQSPKDFYDARVVGSEICGLSCTAMFSLYGHSVAVFESRCAPGGAAHGYSINGCYFDTGPIFFSGLNPNIPPELSNPLRVVLDAIVEEVELIPCETFGLKLPERYFSMLLDLTCVVDF